MVPAADTDYPYRINPNIQWICSVPVVRSPPLEPVADNPDSSPFRDFAFTLEGVTGGGGSKGERGYDWQCLVLTEAADADMGYHLPFRHSGVPARS